jgi:uncharacterized membrane protein
MLPTQPDPLVYIYAVGFFVGTIALIVVGLILIGMFYKGNSKENKEGG